jgi:hypothetical protein
MSTQITHRSPLPKHIPVYIGRQEFVVAYAKGKDVLHLGCVDEGMIEIKQRRGLWLHERLSQVANSLWGVDIDNVGLEQMRSQGYANLFAADIENLSAVPQVFQKNFDLLLLSEVLEHLDNPGRFLSNLKPLFGPETEMLVTVPNSTSLANLLENWRGVELVHPDHNYWFSLHTVQALFNKYSYNADCVGVYSHYDYRRSLTGHQWKKLKRLFGMSSTPSQLPAPALSPPVKQERTTPNLIGWIQAIFTTSLYRFVLSHHPFFADGLIFIVKPTALDRDHFDIQSPG